MTLPRITPHKSPRYTHNMHRSSLLASHPKLLPRSTYWATTCTLPYIRRLGKPIIPHSLHMAEASILSSTPFVTAHNSLIRILRTATQQTSQVIHLYSPNPRPLTTIHRNRHKQCLMQNPCTLELRTPTINQWPDSNWSLHQTRHLPTTLRKSATDSSKTHPKHQNSDTCTNRAHPLRCHTLIHPPHLAQSSWFYLHSPSDFFSYKPKQNDPPSLYTYILFCGCKEPSTYVSFRRAVKWQRLHNLKHAIQSQEQHNSISL